MTTTPGDDFSSYTDEQLADAAREQERRQQAAVANRKEKYYHAPRRKAHADVIGKLQAQYPQLSEEDLEDIWSELNAFHDLWDR